MNSSHRRCKNHRRNPALCILVMGLLAGCQSGGGTGHEQSASDWKILPGDSSCPVSEGTVSNCLYENKHCDMNSKQCVDCTESAHCTNPNAPICHENKCVPCSESNPCAQGICNEGRCLECMTDEQCEPWRDPSEIQGRAMPRRLKTMCVDHVCQPCDFVTCMGICSEGRCIQNGGNISCLGTSCDYSPVMIDNIDPGTRALANRIQIFRVDVADVASTEVALSVQAYKVDAKVNGMYATVTTEFVIFNPNHRVMEGELEFPLPDDAVVSGYAIDINGMMMDAQVVEKKKARMAYENEVKKGIDPGLVEQLKGNAYRTRIYPIPPQGGRRIRVEYTSPLMIAPNGDAALALPMPNTKLATRDITISVVAQGIPAPAVGGLGDARFAQAQAMWVVESHDTNVTPGENVLVAMPNMPDTIVSTEKFGGDQFFMASIKSVEQAQAGSMPNRFRVVWDASGSRSPEDVAKAKELIGHLPENATYELHVFRNVPDPVQTISGRAKLLAILDGLAYDGGTDFSPLEKVAAKKFDGLTLFFTDGMDTMNNALPHFGLNSVAIMTGAARDVSAMRKICGGRTINLDIANGEDAIKQILKVPAAVAKLEGSGINNVEGIGMPSAGRVTIVGRVEPGTSKATIVMSDGKKVSIDIPGSANEGKTLATAWAARRVDDLSPQAEQNRDELLALGRKFSIVSPVSSMLVLENLDQWLEYDIEPPKNSPLHEQWLAQRKTDAERAQEQEEKDNDWIKELTELWDMRVAWYKEPKVKYNPPKKVKPRPVRNWDDDYPDDDWPDDNADAERFNPFEKSANEALQNYCGGSFTFYGTAGGGFSLGSAPEPRPTVEPSRRPVMMMDGGYESAHRDSTVQASRRPTASMANAQAAPVVQGTRAKATENRLDEIVNSTEPSRNNVPSVSAGGYILRPSHGTQNAQYIEEQSARDAEGNVEGDVNIKDWDSDTPYLTAIKDAQKIYKTTDALYKEYLNQRKDYANSPAFYLDCAHLFFKEKKKELAIRILSNLSELKVDDVSLLRVYAWRLRENGDLDDAVVILRKVTSLRPDESNSWRDLAMTLTMRAKLNKDAKDAQEALDLYHKVIFTSWFNESYRGSDDMLNLAVIALEEFNELATWCKRQGWVGNKITIPKADNKFMVNFESDLRIVVSWDADNTDIDLMINEPSGQEIFYGHKCSMTGGILSYDITDGYGPEEFIHKYAPKGKYTVYTNYFASHEQSLIGPATVTVTFYSNWGRSNQKSETVTYRLDEEKDKIKVGEYLLK